MNRMFAREFSVSKAVCLWVILLLGLRSIAGAAEVPNVDELSRELRSLKPDRRAQAAENLGKMGPLATPAVKGLISALSDSNVTVQFEVLIALERIGPAAREAVPNLIKVLEGKNDKLYPGAITVLGAIGPDARDAVAVLMRVVQGDDPLLRTMAGAALARITLDNDELQSVLPILVKALKDPRLAVRNEALAGLAGMGHLAVPALVDVVKGGARDFQSAWLAESALELIGPAAVPAVPTLTESLKSRNDKVVLHAAGALGGIGAAAAPAIPELLRHLKSQNPELRAHIANALGEIGPAAESAVGDLTAALQDRDENVRREAAEALGKIGPAAGSAAPALLQLLDDETGSVAVHAAWAVGRIGGEAVPHLIAALKDPKLQHLAVIVLGDIGPPAGSAAGVLADLLSAPDIDPDLAREILLTLAHIGPDAKAAVPALMKVLKDEKSPVRGGAAWALARIGAKQANEELIKALPRQDDSPLTIVAPIALMVLNPETDRYVQFALPKLMALLNHQATMIRREAAMVLAELGPKAAAAVPELAAGLQDPDPSLRSQFLSALAAIGPDAAQALPAIMQALSDRELPVQYSAIYAVGKIGKAAQQAIPFLEKNLRERDEFLRFASAWALVHVSPQPGSLASECLEPLSQALQLPDPRARAEAVQALGMMGPPARPVVPALQGLAKDPDEKVRKAATEALKAIAK